MFLGSHSKRPWVSVCVVLAGWSLAAVVGCGGSEPFKMIPVSGKITYDDGSLISAARLRLEFKPQAKPIDPKTHPRPGSAEVNVKDGTFGSGKFQATTHIFGDGLIIGKHKVTAFSYDRQDNPTELAVTPSEITVGPESTEFKFTVKRR